MSQNNIRISSIFNIFNNNKTREKFLSNWEGKHSQEFYFELITSIL